MHVLPSNPVKAAATHLEAKPPQTAPFALVCVLLAIATLWVYWPVQHHDFVEFDDADYVAKNVQVQAGLTWAGIRWAFTTGHAGNWHPLTWVSHMIDTRLFGLGPRGPHVTSVLIHLANTLLLFAVLRGLTGALWRSAFVAALFALHPLHVESVAWIAERKDVLSGLFFLLTLWAYEKWARSLPPETSEQSPLVHFRSLFSSPWYLAALLFFAGGLMSKPMLVTLPCVLLLLDYWPLRRMSFGRTVPAGAHDGRAGTAGPLVSVRSLLWEKTPFFLLTVVSSAVTFFVQRRGGAVESLDWLSVGQRLANAVVSYARYLEKTFWPTELAIFYPHPRSWPPLNVMLAALLIVVLAAGILRLGRKFPFVAVGWLWFFGMLIPTVGLVQVGLQSMADRYTYLPLIGVFIVVTWTADHVLRAWRMPTAVVGALAGMVIVACAARTSAQVSHWRDSERLFGHALAVTEANYIAHNSLGHALREQGRVDEAILHFRRALAIWPRFAEAHDNLGHALLAKGEVDSAIAHFRQAVEARPSFVLARYNLGTTLLETGRVEEAIAHLEKAAELRSDDALIQLNLGNARLQKGDAARALAHYENVLALEPDHADAHNNSGSALLQQGRVDEAISRFEQVLRIQPAHANAHFNLGDLLLKLGQTERAIKHLQQTVAIAPEDAEAKQALALALEQQAKKRDPKTK